LAATNTEVRPHILPLLKEAKGVVDQEVFDQLWKLKLKEDITQAAKVLALALGRPKDALVCDYIQKIQDIYGENPTDLIRFRSSLIDILLRAAEPKTDPNIYRQIRQLIF
jgi:hypothetical protein